MPAYNDPHSSPFQRLFEAVEALVSISLERVADHGNTKFFLLK